MVGRLGAAREVGCAVANRFAFPSRTSADDLAEALRAVPGASLVDVVPRYLLAGPRWVVLLRCESEAAMEAAFRVQRIRALEEPDRVQPELQVVGELGRRPRTSQP